MNRKYVLIFLLLCSVTFCPAESIKSEGAAEQITFARNRGDIVVSPNGPEDGGDFGSKTPGTKTSGLQEAFNHAKAVGRDVYIVGGNYNPNPNGTGVWYNLYETLRIPWMQNFRLDAGHAFIMYRGKTGDAIVIDSQMSCLYRFGVIASDADGAVVRLKPTSVGPDKFVVLTTTEFHFNALVGGGGAWKGGEAFKNELDPDHEWIGAGLMLDGSKGSIDSNKISAIEIVGCNIGVYLNEKCTNNWITAPFIHLSNTGIQLGDKGCNTVYNNRVEAHIDSHGIKDSSGARIFGQRNILTLTTQTLSKNRDIIFEAESRDNIITVGQMPAGITNNAVVPTNRIISAVSAGFSVETPPVAPSGNDIINRNPYTIQIIVTKQGSVSQWTLTDVKGMSHVFSGDLFGKQFIALQPGETINVSYEQSPEWIWKAIN